MVGRAVGVGRSGQAAVGGEPVASADPQAIEEIDLEGKKTGR